MKLLFVFLQILWVFSGLFSYSDFFFILFFFCCFLFIFLLPEWMVYE